MEKYNILQLFGGEGGGSAGDGQAAAQAPAPVCGDTGAAAAQEGREQSRQEVSSLERRLAALERARGEDYVRRHFQSMEQQGEQLRQLHPDFDLREELKNPVFARMVSPSVGLGVREAYYAVHHQQLQTQAMAVAARKTAQKLTNAMRAGTLRPEENGTTPQGASLTSFDSRRATPAQREALKQRIRQAAARGEKLYPGK